MPFLSRARQMQWPANIPASFHDPDLEMASGGGQAGAASAAMSESLSTVIRDMSLPAATAAGRPMPREEAALLLQIASEVEHAFLLQYLYAGYSLNGASGELAATASGSFINIARQEMAHLITVQNLLLSLGLAYDFNREDFPKHPDVYPFPAALEPVSSYTIAKYVTAEAPAIEDITDTAIKARALQAADHAALVVKNIHRVGALYAVLYWLFQAGDQPEGPLTLSQPVIDVLIHKYGAGFHLKDTDFGDPVRIANFAATSDEWGAFGGMNIDPSFPRGSALTALFHISVQGEGSGGGAEPDSHFRVFLDMYRDFPQFPAGAVADIPSNPFILPAERAATGALNEISDSGTANWAQLLNLRYRILLLDILTAMSLDRTKEAALRSKMILEWAVPMEMVGNISVIAQALTSRQRTPAAADRPNFAGAPFVFGEALPETVCGQWKEQLFLRKRCSTLISKMAALATTTETEKGFLRGISDFDDTRQSVIDDNIHRLCN